MKTITQFPAIPVQPQISRPRSRVFIWFKRIALGLAFGIGSLAVIGAAYQSIATAIDKRAFPPPGQLIDVGGFQVHLRCAGANVDGSPTVILENGLGSTSSAWALEVRTQFESNAKIYSLAPVLFV